VLFTIIIRKKIAALIILLIIITILLSYLKLTHNRYSLPSNTDDMEFRVVIDPGHGGIDTGTSYGKIYEKEINLRIATRLNQELRKVNIITYLTRTEDKLYQDSRRRDIAHRPEIAREKNADLFISIHTNNFPSAQPAGSQVFYKRGSEPGKRLAEEIQAELVKLRKENDRCLKTGDYYVLNQAPCPAVLIEVGFLSNPVDRQKLTDPDYQQLIASSIKNGIINYFQSGFGRGDLPELPATKSRVMEERESNSLYYIANRGQDILLLQKGLSCPTNKPADEVDYRLVLLQTALDSLLTPPAGLYSPLPPGTRIRSLGITGEKAIIDFSSELRDNYQWGAGMESLTVQAISNTILSIPGIEDLEILIEGEKDSTIGGHIILNPE
jgi:N-acetylmuramoyl-L-alanine amidase